MALRSVIDIDVNDERFKEFVGLFEKYRDGLGKMPNQWGQFNAGVGQTHELMSGMAALMLAQFEMIHKMDKEEKSLERTTSRVGRAMGTVAKHTHTIYQNVVNTSRELMKWTGISGLFGGLLGVGSLYGLERMAGNASHLRSQAMGLGVQPGQLLAARTNFGQFFNTESALGNIAGLQSSLSGVVPFNTLGIGGAWNAGASGGLTAAMEAVHRLYRQTPAGQRRNMPWYHAALQIFGSDEAIRTIGNMGDKEFRQHISDYQKDAAGNFGLQPGVLRAAQDVDRQLTRLGYTLEYTFLAALKPVMPELEHLSKAVGDVVITFLKSDGFKYGVELLTKGLHELGDWIGSPDFREDVKGFVDGLANMVKAIGRVVAWIGGWIGNNTSTDDPRKADFQNWVHSQGGPPAGDQHANWRRLWVKEHMPLVDRWLAQHPEPEAFGPGSGLGYSFKRWGETGFKTHFDGQRILDIWRRGRLGGGDANPPNRAAWDAASTIKDPEIAAAASIIAWRESKDQDINNGIYHITGYRNGVPLGYTASGYYQMLATNWHKYGAGIVDFSKYNEARGAPRWLQDAVFERMFRAEGYSPWSARAGGSIKGDEDFHAAMRRRMAASNYKAPGEDPVTRQSRYAIWGLNWSNRHPLKVQVKIDNQTGASPTTQTTQAASP